MPEPTLSNNSPLWSRTTKTIIVVGALLLLAALFLRFRALIIMLVVAAILAYLLDPLISFIAVSYTHLDVYKRQVLIQPAAASNTKTGHHTMR